MKTKLQKLLLILHSLIAVTSGIQVFRECIKTSKGSIISDYLQSYSPLLVCRSGQVLTNKTVRYQNDEIKMKYCCDIVDMPAVQTATEPCLANTCSRDKDGTFWRGCLFVHGPDLYCDPGYELISVSTLANGDMVKASCCERITTTTLTTTPLTTEVPTTTTKGTTPYKPPPPFMEPDEICLKAGNDCVYQSDGSVKINYMDFEARGAYCRPGQSTRLEYDSKNRKRVCCEPSPGATTIDLPPLCPTNCALEEDGVTPQKWSLMQFTPDLICKPNFSIKVVDTAGGKKCCCFDDRLTTTTSTTSTTTSTTSTTSTTTPTTTSTTSTSTTTTPTTTSTTSTTTSTSTTSTTTSTTSTTTKPTTTSTTSTSTSTSTTLPTTSSTTTKPLTTSTVLPSTTLSIIPTDLTTIPPDEPPSALQACYFTANRKVKTDLMEKCNPNKKCRANEVMLDETVDGKKLCCCDQRKDLPPPSETDPKLLAPKCYYDQDGNVIPFSTLTAGLDLICPNTSQMMNYTDEKDPSMCCILKTMTTVLPKTVPPGTPPPADVKVVYPDCTFTPEGKVISKNMMYCSLADKVCRPNFRVKTKDYVTAKGEDTQKCCCEVDPNPPPIPSPPPVYAPVCVISPYTKTVKKWSMVKSGPDLVCKEGFKLYTIDVPVLFKTNVTESYSCCLPNDQNMPPPGTPENVKYAGPACSYKENKEIDLFLMEKCSVNMACRDQERVVNKTVKDPVTNLDTLRCCCEFDPKLPHKDSKTPIRAHDCYFDYFGYIVMNSLVPFGKDLQCQKSFSLVNYTVDVEAKPTVFSCCFPDGATTIKTTPFSGPTISTTKPMTTSTTPGGPPGKRTPAPKKMPDREVKPGECPSCIMPESAQKADINWIIAHLERPGPPVGKCPSGWTMRRIYPVVERRDLTSTKCCCECDAFPLPVKLSG